MILRHLGTCVSAAAFALAVLSPGTVPAQGGPAQEGPAAVVERFHTDLLGVMRNAGRLGYRGRVRMLSPAIDDAFHMPEMARLVAGSSRWKSLSDDRKRAFVDAFTRMTTATYAHRFKGFAGEGFRTLETVPVRAETVLVKTSLTRSGGEAVQLSYLLRRFGDGWRVIDIFLKGTISELATRRSEYASVLRRKGFDALIARIDDTVASLEADSAKE